MNKGFSSLFEDHNKNLIIFRFDEDGELKDEMDELQISSLLTGTTHANNKIKVY